MEQKTEKTFLGLTRERISVYICPLLLACSVCFASIYTFHKASAYVLTVLFFFEAVYLFKLFDRLKSRKSGALIYTLMLAVSFFISFLLVVFHAASYGYYSPMRWFYAQDDSEVFYPDMIAALFIAGGFFLISVIYYFTMVRYRTMGVMLCTMFPFFFFAKRSDIMPDILITLIMLLFLAVIIHNKRINKTDRSDGNTHLQTDRAYIICISAFILITGAVTMAIEKPYYQSFLEKNSRLLNPFNMNIGSSGGYEELSEQSSPRNAAPSYNYEPLFYLETNSGQDEIFLRTKAYDIFNGEVWVNANKQSFYFYSLQMPEYTTEEIAADVSALTGDGGEGLYSVYSGRLYDEDFTPRYLPAPYGIITDDRPASALKYRKSSFDTSVIRSTVYYYYLEPLNDSFEFTQAKSALYDRAAKLNFNSEEYISYLESFGGRQPAEWLLKDYREALDGYTDLSGVSDRLKELALQITGDCHSDLEKAQKLESYFSLNGFTYSLSYVPDDNSVDYFVFESKTGYCAGYATAMTLMARAVGLPARYVEGFAAFERGDDGNIIIRDGYAHAFVEVYIPGAGWLTFDPTVSDYRTVPDGNAQGEGLGILSRIVGIFNRISVVIVIAVILIMFALLERIRELFVRLVIRFKPLNERIISLYGNLIRAAGISAGSDFSAYTPDMLRDYLAEKTDSVPETLISLFERVAFGGCNCTGQEYRLAYREYRQCYRNLRRPLRSLRQKRKA